MPMLMLCGRAGQARSVSGLRATAGVAERLQPWARSGPASGDLLDKRLPHRLPQRASSQIMTNQP